ncbi:MAG: hypothetical protein ACOYB3_01655, partial [Azonexus sp.]
EHPDHGTLFEGFEPRECGEHRTVGSYRAWCFDDTEWCYPTTPCRGCEIVSLREKITTLETALDETTRGDDL